MGSCTPEEAAYRPEILALYLGLESKAERSVTGHQAEQPRNPGAHGDYGVKEVTMSLLRVQPADACYYERIVPDAQARPCAGPITRPEPLEVHSVRDYDDLVAGDTFMLDQELGGSPRHGDDSLAPPRGCPVEPPSHAGEIRKRCAGRRHHNRNACQSSRD